MEKNSCTREVPGTYDWTEDRVDRVDIVDRVVFEYLLELTGEGRDSERKKFDRRSRS